MLNGPLETVFPYFNLEAEHIINVTPEESEIIQCAFRDLITEYERFSPEKDYLLRNYIHILLLRVREIYRPHAQQMSQGTTHTMKLANHFKHLLEKNFVKMREVKQYANALHITPKHLLDVVKSTFGKTPRQMINDMLLLEAKVWLGSTDLTVSEIAYKLQFQDHAHFSHFIRQHAGCTPLELRKKL
jgi:AraC-like DNA-binding protein